MSVRSLALLACLLLWPCALTAQGFAGLGEASDDYARPDPDYRFAFPRDHGAHPLSRIEWWYVTANLTGEDGARYGMQWTLFRSALSPGGAAENQAWMGHAAISSPGGHHYAERLARGGIGQAGVTAQPFEAFIDEWRMTGDSLNTLDVTAQGTDFRYDLTLSSDGPIVPQGMEGYSVKSEAGQASHYYSQPFYRVEGSLTLPSGPVKVTGRAWLDREWSSQPLASDQVGWDWVSLHLEDGAKLMGFQLRSRSGETYTTGTWIARDGRPTPLGIDAMRFAPVGVAEVAGRDIPVAWDITLPERDVSIRVTALYPDSWMGTRIPYWEGPVTVTGSHEGEGYLEMSGY